MSQDLQTLRTTLAFHNDAYSRGAPMISDEEYDQLWAQLRKLSPEDPLLYHTSAPRTNQNYNFTHSRPWLSLDKAMTPEDMNLFLTRVQNHVLHVSPKLHGVGAVEYDERTLVLLGDGNYGIQLPHTLASGGPENHWGTYPSRGEIIIKNKNWDPALGKTPCAVVSGFLTKWCNGNLPSLQKSLLSFVPFRWFHKGRDRITLNAWELIRDQDKCQSTLLELYAEWSSLYPLDGLVLSIDDQKVHSQYGQTAYYPNWAIAWKPPISLAETTVTKVAWKVSRTGRVVPKVHYKGVELCGTLNTKATANNAEWVSKRGIAVGAEIVVGKAGEIIPQIVRVSTPAFPEDCKIPAFCPICTASLARIGVDLICSNPDCIGSILRKVEYFYSPNGVNLEGFGPKIAEELCTSHPSVARMFSNRPWLLLLGLSDGIESSLIQAIIKSSALYTSYLSQLQAYQSQGIHLARLVQALGLPSIGATASSTAAYLLTHNEMPKGGKFTVKQLTSLASNIQLVQQMLRELSPLFTIIKPSAGALKSFSISGSFDLSREDIVNLLTSAGWTYHTHPNANTQYFFLGSHRDTKKHNKEVLALKHGTPTYGQAELTSILSEVMPNGSSD